DQELRPVAANVVCSNPHCRASISVAEGDHGGSHRCARCGCAGLPSSTRVSLRSSSHSAIGERALEPRSSLRTGMIFDQRYRIDRRLGEGGMGTVFLAFDLKLGRPIALKIPSFPLETYPDLVKRFHREARIAAAFDHPNLCQ